MNGIHGFYKDLLVPIHELDLKFSITTLVGSLNPRSTTVSNYELLGNVRVGISLTSSETKKKLLSS